jgi:mono/diheme cytochrome c family protein
VNARVLGIAATGALIAACRTEQTIVTPDPHLERMLDQEKARPYDESAALPLDMAMQKPPEGTVPFAYASEAPLVGATVEGRWTAHIPVHVDRAFVERGRRDFETFCATCHGILGDGTSAVAPKMRLRKPENLTDADARSYPPGRVFQAIRAGYGLMPSYAVQLSERESWAVVAYVRALQIARGTRLSELPPGARAELGRSLATARDEGETP